jgi:hypothetical protein
LISGDLISVWRATGSRRVKVVPAPGVEAAVTEPPWFLMME